MFIPDLPSLVPLAQWRPRVIFLVQNAEVSQQKPKKKVETPQKFADLDAPG